ncbi:PUCC protein [Kouleothrix aurantiaca]|uniref:PUCC protein n=1 Tax=Kouleothrix aurantiaca TaxID=186479 RepID=A0A0P9DCI8_9CHLR|nr:PUCC protein [Kouleothrix aurantiaca]
MPFTKIIRLGLLHMAVAITLVPINSTLNRIMISELGLAATLVAALVSLPYLFSPLQVWIGSYSDAHPLLGYRRTPYILLGLLLCAGGAALAPRAAFAMHDNLATGLPLGVLAFGAWGMGFNFATVSYLSLATDLAGEEQRARTVGVMWFMLIASVIVTAIMAARALRPYNAAPLSPEGVAALYRVFYWVVGVALALGAVGLLGLERRGAAANTGPRQSFAAMLRAVGANAQARLFFVYLVLLLIALLGQDVLLEPYAADVFGVPVSRTTEYTGIWGIALLVALLLASPLTRRVGKARAAALGGMVAGLGLVLIAASGWLQLKALLIVALVIFGFGSGLSTATNVALMLDMTLAGQVGAFIGAWGMADALARLGGTLLSGVVRDTINVLTGNAVAAYTSVFLIEAALLGVSLVLLRRIDVARFHGGEAPSAVELAGYAEL